MAIISSFESVDIDTVDITDAEENLNTAEEEIGLALESVQSDLRVLFVAAKAADDRAGVALATPALSSSFYIFFSNIYF